MSMKGFGGNKVLTKKRFRERSMGGEPIFLFIKIMLRELFLHI
jgi:hypothetical protein